MICPYFFNGAACKYCEITPVGKVLDFLGQNEFNDLMETINLASQTDEIRSISLSSGSYTTSEKIAEYYLKLGPFIKERNITSHIHLEPLTNEK